MKPSSIAEFYREELIENVMPFWLENSVDDQFGGCMTCLDREGSVVDTDKGVWQQGRFGWLLAKLYNECEENNRWLGIAESMCCFLRDHCFDKNDGRMWFHVTREGAPIRKRRYSYSESFAAIAYGELARATGNAEWHDAAIRCFEKFVKESEAPSSEPKFESIRAARNIGIPMIKIGTAQQLRQSVKLENADQIIDMAIEQIRRFHFKAEHKCVMETVGLDGKVIDHFDGRTLNPGHAIEAAWFILSEGKYRSDSHLIDMGCQMLDWMWERGWDKRYGGILYFVDFQGHPVSEYWHDMKFWWPQNETIIATLLAYQLTGKKKYETWYQLVHDWAFSRFPDQQHGEWFGYLHRDGSVSSPLKGNLWKGPFHLPRMLFLCSTIANEMG